MDAIESGIEEYLVSGAENVFKCEFVFGDVIVERRDLLADRLKPFSSLLHAFALRPKFVFDDGAFFMQILQVAFRFFDLFSTLFLALLKNKRLDSRVAIQV